MKSLANLLVRVVREDDGGEVIEYALIAGMISTVAITAISSVGQKVLAMWTKLDAALS